MKLLVDARWKGPHGIGRFASEVLKRLPEHEALTGGLPPLHPLEPFWLSFMIRQKRPDLYFSPGYNPPLSSSAPFVFTIYDLIHLRFPSERGHLKELYYRTVVLPAVWKARKVLTVSEFSKRQIVEWSRISPDRVAVVGSGVGDEFSVEGATYSPSYPYLLYIGNRKPHKNVPRMLQGFAQSRVWPEAKLILTGDPDARTMELVRALNIEPYIIFAGIVADTDLPALYRGATALIFPSLYEGFGLPPLEAMACGTPVVCSSLTSLREVVGGINVSIDPLQTDSIAAGIRKVVEDGSLRSQLRLQGLERAKEYTWDRTVQSVMDVLRDA